MKQNLEQQNMNRSDLSATFGHELQNTAGLADETSMSKAPQTARPLWLTIPLIIAGSYGAYRLFNYARSALAPKHGLDGRLSARVANQLPIAKNLKTISDQEGNYDLDGVSFDTEGVIISSDSIGDDSFATVTVFTETTFETR
jgi:hypothetical protein